LAATCAAPRSVPRYRIFIAVWRGGATGYIGRTTERLQFAPFLPKNHQASAIVVCARNHRFRLSGPYTSLFSAAKGGTDNSFVIWKWETGRKWMAIFHQKTPVMAMPEKK
jgi:hypothetical protein